MFKTFRFGLCVLLDVARVGEGDLNLEGVSSSSDRMPLLFADETICRRDYLQTNLYTY